MLGKELFDKIIIDGKEVDINEIDNNNGKIYLENGEHNIEYVFKKHHAEIPSDLFQNCSDLTYFKIPKHFNVKEYALEGTNLDNANDFINNYPSSCYNFKNYLYIGPIKPNSKNIVKLFNSEYSKFYDYSKYETVSDPEDIGRFKINVNESYNDKLYLCLREDWLYTSDDYNYTIPTLKDPNNNIINISNDINYEYIEFGYIKYIILSFDFKGSGIYTCILNNYYFSSNYKCNYELYNENNEIVSSGRCEVSKKYYKYNKGIEYYPIYLNNYEYIYYIICENNLIDYNKLYNTYDHYLINTNLKVKFSEDTEEE